MLAGIAGRPTAPPWGPGPRDTVLAQHDGPRLLLRRSRRGDLYLGWWSDSDESTERWIFLWVSRVRLREILTGRIPAMGAMRGSERGIVYVQEVGVGGNTLSVVSTNAGNLPADARPREGARLNVPVPRDLDDAPVRNRTRQILDSYVDNIRRGRPPFLP